MVYCRLWIVQWTIFVERKNGGDFQMKGNTPVENKVVNRFGNRNALSGFPKGKGGNLVQARRFDGLMTATAFSIFQTRCSKVFCMLA